MSAHIEKCSVTTTLQADVHVRREFLVVEKSDEVIAEIVGLDR